MRYFKLLVLGGIVLALSSSAWAVSVPSIDTGVLYIPCRNQDKGTSYYINNVAQLTKYDPITNPNGRIDYTFDPRQPLPTGITRVQADGALNNTPTGAPEDGWGLVLMREISPGILNPGDSSVDRVPGSTAFYSVLDGANPVWLVGMFYGVQDTSLTITAQTGIIPTALGFSSSFTALSDNLNIELYAVDKAFILTDDIGNPSNALDPTNLQRYVKAFREGDAEYTNWLDIDEPKLAGHFAKLLTGVSSYHKFTGTLNPNFHFTGSTDVWLNTVPGGGGAWDQVWDGNLFTDPAGNKADIYINFLIQNGSRDWDASSHDFGGVLAVPEPVTMAGMLLGIGCLGRYLRKRR